MSGFLLPMVVVMFCHINLLPYSASSKLMEKAIQLGRQNSRGANGIIYLLCYQGRRLCNYRYLSNYHMENGNRPSSRHKVGQMTNPLSTSSRGR
ncbi:hypothetical protein CTAM01_09443 [Colletotrichum tamarilloi]|uniref:Secreted protein n=1 Tax=Colletotrichum tamarilloi TaxID=1209934 RepID=A0ABQ9R3A1_9PEZI|nr:uncharacterized protein CTAM01_09443 [Colletotrichum tamarilloi]KAK1493299.1 hypothetical protein CTAM01_09443 [Colletotrichum tamarilloi]